jgi:hypothetical protein
MVHILVSDPAEKDVSEEMKMEKEDQFENGIPTRFFTKQTF